MSDPGDENDAGARGFVAAHPDEAPKGTRVGLTDDGKTITLVVYSGPQVLASVAMGGAQSVKLSRDLLSSWLMRASTTLQITDSIKGKGGLDLTLWPPA